VAFTGAWILGSASFLLFGIEACYAGMPEGGDLGALGEQVMTWVTGEEQILYVCEVGAMATYQIAACVLYFAAMILNCLAPR
jgi:hypothetical protein